MTDRLVKCARCSNNNLPKTLALADITAERAATFWSLVDKSAGPDACWPWTGSKHYRISGGPCDYGLFRVVKERGFYGAHIVAFVLSGGDRFGGPLVLHTCDNPPCCNPTHLFSGTYKTNMVDRARKLHTVHVVTPDLVRTMRARHATERVSAYRMAKELGISGSCVRAILTRQNWDWVE